MLRHPVPVIAASLPMRLTHATDQPSVPQPTFAPNPVVIRRTFAPEGTQEPDRPTLLGFLQRGPGDWTCRQSEPEASGALLGGTLGCDLAASATIVIEGQCLAPNTDGLDLEGVTGPKAQSWAFELMRIEGLPQPADGRAGLRELDLAELTAAALGPAHSLGTALRAVLSGKPVTRGARRLNLRVTALGRHTGLMPDPTRQPGAAP